VTLLGTPGSPERTALSCLLDSSLLAGLSDTRVIAAVAIVLSYLAFSAYFLRPLWRPRSTEPIAPATTLIAYATQTGYAQQVATQTARSLQSAGRDVQIASISDVAVADLTNVERALFVVSTTGEGDAPDPAAGFVRRVLAGSAGLQTLKYGVLALGDREYDNFCAFGHQLDQWLKHQGAQSLFDVVEVDNGDEGALRHWQHNLSLVFDAPDLPDWETPTYERWKLSKRELMNPGSAGDPCYFVELTPLESSTQWQAGDIAEIDPFNSHRAEKRHPHREYSIASVPSDRAIHLVVRQMRRSAGELGLGSGWLTHSAIIGEDIAVRVRSNPNFHLPDVDAPLILIGNGTGIAGLRALLKARIERGQRRNWLIFGERNTAHDAFFDDELKAWEAQGWLDRLDRVYSRDQTERRYVQHRIAECAPQISKWIARGAYVYVCGSLEGMAPGVNAALVAALGESLVDQLTIEGRYRRDVY
jgi:sulfite reductase (NADPH) flavoprotein alpha-component